MVKLALGCVVGLVIGAVGVVLAVAGGLFNPSPRVPSTEWGQFPARPQVEMLLDGRKLRLLEDFVYIDPRGKAWLAPKDTVVDGASIPRLFWTAVSGPLEGMYRDASIVHDHGCNTKSEPWEDVHLMFYEGCRCGGVPESQAKLLYAAVYHFGPRWELRPVFETKETKDWSGKAQSYTVERAVVESAQPPTEPAEEVRAKLERLIKDQNPTLEELRRLDPSRL